MERLIADAAKLDESVDANSLSFGNVVKAIHAVQVEMGIYGTTATEASTTIQGSLSSLQAAWQNLLTGIADPNQKFGDMIDNLVDTASTFVDNVLPVATQGLVAIARLAKNLLPKIAKELPSVVVEVLPLVANTALSVVDTFLDTISDNAVSFTDSAIPMIENFANGVLDSLPKVASLAVDLIIALANGLVDNNTLSEMIPAVVGVVNEIFNIITEPENMKAIHEAASALLIELANGIGDAIPMLVDAIVAIIENIALFLYDPENLGTLISAAFQIVVAIAGGLIAAIPELFGSVAELVGSVADQIINSDWGEVGKRVVDGLGKGLANAWGNIKTWAKNAWDGIVGFFTGETPDIDIPEYNSGGRSGSFGGTVANKSPAGINVVQNIYSQKQTAADLMEEALYAQQRAVYLS